MILAEREISVYEGQPDLDRANELTAAGFVRPIDGELRQDVEDHLNDGHKFYRAVDELGNDIAYSIFCDYQSTLGSVLYLSGIIVDPDYQGRGVSKEIIGRALEENSPDYFSFRTQSARMYEAGRKIVRELFPKIEDNSLMLDIPEDIQKVGDFVASIKGGQFPLTESCYGGKPLYGERPHHASSDDFYRHCDFNKGDALLCVGRVIT